MRLRNIKGAHDIIGENNHVIIDPIKYKGKFSSLFKNNNPIELEIGSGKGNFIIEKAKQNPDVNFIGMERYASVLVKLVKKLDDLTLSNLKIICYDASDIENIFNKEIDKLYLNFSDPWPKKKHADRRLTSHIFLKKYDDIFKKYPVIEMKTDNYKLFAYSLVSLSTYNYVLQYVSLNLHEEDEINIMTEYEDKFSSLGYPIYKLMVTRQTNDKLDKK